VTPRIAKKIYAAVDNMAIATGIFPYYDMMGQFLELHPGGLHVFMTFLLHRRAGWTVFAPWLLIIFVEIGGFFRSGGGGRYEY
jgi:hypothetical protein